MQQNEVAAFFIKGLISEMPQEDQNKVKSIKQQIIDLVKTNDPHGGAALTLAIIELEATLEKGLAGAANIPEKKE